MTDCDKCGQPMIELSGWDFKHDMCLNHDPPHHIFQNWCDKGHAEDRELLDWENDEIAKRKDLLEKRLKVVKTPREVWSVVLLFLYNGFNPEIDGRIAGAGSRPAEAPTHVAVPVGRRDGFVFVKAKVVKKHRGKKCDKCGLPPDLCTCKETEKEANRQRRGKEPSTDA